MSRSSRERKRSLKESQEKMDIHSIEDLELEEEEDQSRREMDMVNPTGATSQRLPTSKRVLRLVQRLSKVKELLRKRRRKNQKRRRLNSSLKFLEYLSMISNKE